MGLQNFLSSITLHYSKLSMIKARIDSFPDLENEKFDEI